LRRGRGSSPRVVIRRVHVGQREGSAGRNIERNRFALGTRVVSTANGNVLAEVACDLNASCALDANLGNIRSAQLKFAIAVAVETTDRLASAALGKRPLRLLVTRGACVGTERVCSASTTSRNGSLNIADRGVQGKISIEVGNNLNTRPSLKSKPVEGDSSVFRWES